METNRISEDGGSSFLLEKVEKSLKHWIRAQYQRGTKMFERPK
ncbi:predicted protein [Botrytis cinerea T4]|uniref:Uncharacterized protein n=1 Tax=Botryotinia fuckeliana (strain T4) TaxID=999810 RepID=G2YIW8_BOTF4|nr:predicted protein [Botrytis cinerea T4]